jgi:histidinol-phosphate/aromatic aminotransferase/cobyric acid decarboxylase-like protein
VSTRVAVPVSGEHGGDGRAVAVALGIDPASILDLSLSLNPVAPDLGELIRAQLDAGALSRYPDAHDVQLATDALAQCIGVQSSRVVVTAGGAEAIALVAAELGTGSVRDPDFSLYRKYIPTIDPNGPLFRSDPNNPTGQLVGDADVSSYRGELSGPMLSGAKLSGPLCHVWDEAFYPLATGRWSRLSTPGCSDTGSTIVLGSLTKVFACPGLRLGYVVVPADDGESIGHPGLSTRLRGRQPQWQVATPALCALPDLVAMGEVEKWANAIAALRCDLVDTLVGHGLSPRDSDANFVLVDGASGLRERLARLGVIVRGCRSFGLPDSIRIAVPDEAGLERLDRALKLAGTGELAGARELAGTGELAGRGE